MERESFEDEAAAELLNKHFVAIKVSHEWFNLPRVKSSLAWSTHGQLLFPSHLHSLCEKPAFRIEVNNRMLWLNVIFYYLPIILNIHYPPIHQVDREERPDVDRVYVSAHKIGCSLHDSSMC